jgi:hypothetical protein
LEVDEKMIETVVEKVIAKVIVKYEHASVTARRRHQQWVLSLLVGSISFHTMFVNCHK